MEGVHVFVFTARLQAWNNTCHPDGRRSSRVRVLAGERRALPPIRDVQSSLRSCSISRIDNSVALFLQNPLEWAAELHPWCEFSAAPREALMGKGNEAVEPSHF